MYCALKGLIADNVVETRSLYAKIIRELVPNNDDELSICQNLIKAIKLSFKRKLSNNNPTRTIVIEEKTDVEIVKETAIVDEEKTNAEIVKEDAKLKRKNLKGP